MSVETYEELLKRVPDSYEHFVDYSMWYADYFNVTNEVISFLKANKGATSSDVIKEIHQLVHGE